MSASLNQRLSNLRHRPEVLIPIVLLAVVAWSCLVGRRPTKQWLMDKLTSQLRAEKFEELYEEAIDRLRFNVTKGKFIQRMKIAVAKMRAIDENLNFQRDFERETGFPENGLLIVSIQKLEKGERSASVLIHWDDEGNFFDLSVYPGPGTPEELSVYGVSYQHLYIGNRMVDDPPPYNPLP